MEKSSPQTPTAFSLGPKNHLPLSAKGGFCRREGRTCVISGVFPGRSELPGETWFLATRFCKVKKPRILAHEGPRIRPRFLDVQAQTENRAEGSGLPGSCAFLFLEPHSLCVFCFRRGLIFSPQIGDAPWRRIHHCSLGGVFCTTN